MLSLFTFANSLLSSHIFKVIFLNLKFHSISLRGDQLYQYKKIVEKNPIQNSNSDDIIFETLGRNCGMCLGRVHRVLSLPTVTALEKAKV